MESWIYIIYKYNSMDFVGYPATGIHETMDDNGILPWVV